MAEARATSRVLLTDISMTFFPFRGAGTYVIHAKRTLAAQTEVMIRSIMRILAPEYYKTKDSFNDDIVMATILVLASIGFGVNDVCQRISCHSRI